MIILYNTKTKTKEEFNPISEKKVCIYSCGPTVYHYAHIGNLRAYVLADTLNRLLRLSSYDVFHIINITDVGHLVGDGNTGEDKLEKGSAREGKTAFEVAEFYTKAFFEDLDNLLIQKERYLFPKATDHIKEQIDLIKKLEDKNYTYVISDDGVYFDTSKFPNYANFAHLDVEGLKKGARIEENINKKNITDFALWKFSPKEKKRQMEWDSPWGIGFPGWHIECSAMSMKYLGEHFDIHTGGIDHIPVHHTNEIAQSECVTGKTYVNYWMHTNFLIENNGKMSKSSNDFITLNTLIEKGYNPLSYKYFLLMTHYRKEINFSFDALDAATNAYKKIVDFIKENKKEDTGKILKEYIDEVLKYLSDDLNTSEALAVIWKILKNNEIKNEDKYKTLIKISEILGLGLENIQIEKRIVSDEIKNLLKLREEARNRKDFNESDRLREEIKKLGFIVKDTKDGQDLELI